MYKHRILEVLGVLLFFTLITLIITFPAVIHLTTSIIGDTGDNFQFLGFQFVGNKLFREGNFPFGWTNLWRYPDGINFQNATDSGLFMILGIFLYPILSNPLAVYNLSVLILVVLNLFFTYLAFRMIFRSFVSFIGSVIYGLSFYTIARIGGHPNLILQAGFPLFFISIFLIWKEKGSLKSFALFTLAIVFLTISSLQYPLLLLGSLIMLLPITYFMYPSESKSFLKTIIERKSYTILSLAVFSLSTLMLYGHKISLFLLGEVALPDYKFISVPLLDYFIPNSYIVSLPFIVANHSKSWIEYAVFLGYVELFLFIAAIIFIKRDAISKFLFISLFALVVISLGKQSFLPIIWPYQYLIEVFPFRGIVEPGRFFVVFYFFLTLMILIYISRFKKFIVLIGILALILIERTPAKIHITEIAEDEPFITAVKYSHSNAVLDLPIFTEWWNGNLYDLYYLYHQKPIVNGYIHWSGDKYNPKSLIEELKEYRCHPFPVKSFDEELANFRKERASRLLNYYNIRTVVYHKEFAREGDCYFTDQYIQSFINQPEKFVVLYEDAEKKVLWLKKD